MTKIITFEHKGQMINYYNKVEVNNRLKSKFVVMIIS